MNIQTKFDLGQRVHIISYTRRQIRIPCPECGGVSEMVTPTGGTIKCDRCRNAVFHGHPMGTIGSYEDSAWHITGQGTVGQIRTITNDYNGGNPTSDFDNFKPQAAGSDKEEYMLWETGIGSGTLHKAGDLFSTREEAQAECDRREALKDEE